MTRLDYNEDNFFGNMRRDVYDVYADNEVIYHNVSYSDACYLANELENKCKMGIYDYKEIYFV